MEIHVFADDYEWYVAETVEQARAMQRELIGENPGEEGDWGQCDDDTDLMIWLDGEGDITEIGDGILVIGTHRVWAEAFGEGLLCTTEC